MGNTNGMSAKRDSLLSVLSTCVTKQTGDIRYREAEPLWFLGFRRPHDDAVCPGKRVVSPMSVVVVLAKSVRQHRHIVGSYPAAAIILLAIAIQIVYAGWLEHTAMHAIGYLLAVWCGCLMTDIVVNMAPAPAVGFPIRHPSTQELFVILGSVSLGAIFLTVRFSSHWTTIHGMGSVPGARQEAPQSSALRLCRPPLRYAPSTPLPLRSKVGNPTSCTCRPCWRGRGPRRVC